MLAVAPVLAALLALARPAGALPPPGLIDGATASGSALAARRPDVRSAGEFESGHVPGALNTPHDRVAARAAEVGAKSKPVLVYCRSGRRSAMAVAGSSAAHGHLRLQDHRRLAGPIEGRVREVGLTGPGPCTRVRWAAAPPAPRRGPGAGRARASGPHRDGERRQPQQRAHDAGAAPAAPRLDRAAASPARRRRWSRGASPRTTQPQKSTQPQDGVTPTK